MYILYTNLLSILFEWDLYWTDFVIINLKVIIGLVVTITY